MKQTHSLLDGLNEKQIEAVTTTEGPVLIIAGAGSGKTRVITHRIAYLIQGNSVSPWNIVGVTFTNKAANEVRERVMRLLHNRQNYQYDLFHAASGNKEALSVTEEIVEYQNVEHTKNLPFPHLGTFHSMCVKILRQHAHLLGYENSFVIYDTADQIALIKVLLKEMNIDEKICNPRAVLSHIGGAKNELLSFQDYEKLPHGNFFTKRVAHLYSLYQKRLQQNRAFDFDDLLMKTVELFQQHPDVLSYYQNKFRYILVDEYQDTNHAQYVLVNLLAKAHRNLCVVGDSDQSIYSWRGADIRNILEFEKDYPETKVIKLEQNYRSTKTILDTAHNVIVKNTQRKDKTLWTEREQGEKVFVITARDEREEGECIVHQVRAYTKGYEYPPYAHFAVLYRTNAQSRVLEEVFLRHGIPYKIVGGVKFYERKEIKDVMAYLRLALNPHDDVSFLRIINTPPRKIGKLTLSRLQNYSNRSGGSLYDALTNYGKLGVNPVKERILEKFLQLLDDLHKANREFPASGVIKQILHLTGYQDFLLQERTEEGEQRLENVRELSSVASKYDQLEHGISLSTFLEEVSLISDIDTLDEKENAVTFMTVHSAKGLEFPYVFICGLEEGVFPHSRSLLERDALEEERRLMYVGITRAMERVFLLYAEKRLLYGENRHNAPSQFLNDIPEELIVRFPQMGSYIEPDFDIKPIPVEDWKQELYKEGDSVMHDYFGIGRIISVKGDIVTIEFQNQMIGVKKLALSVAPLHKIENHL